MADCGAGGLRGGSDTKGGQFCGRKNLPFTARGISGGGLSEAEVSFSVLKVLLPRRESMLKEFLSFKKSFVFCSSMSDVRSQVTDWTSFYNPATRGTCYTK